MSMLALKIQNVFCWTVKFLESSPRGEPPGFLEPFSKVMSHLKAASSG